MFNKAIIKSKAQKIIFLILFISVGLDLILTVYEQVTDTLFFFLGITSSHTHLFLRYVIILSATLSVGLFFKHMIVKFLLTIVLLIGCIYLTIGPFLVINSGNYYTINSPDRNRRIVVRESPSSSGSGCIFYQSTNPFFIKRAVDGSYKGGVFEPFKNHLYTVKWYDDKAVITYPQSEGDNPNMETVEIDFD